MQHTPCLVTVIIPVFNSVSTLDRAIDSVLRQTVHDTEVFIVDDGSRDDSLALAREFAATDHRIEVIALPRNQGKSHAMNMAIAVARGRWIAVLDADDWYEPDRLAILVSEAEAFGVPLVADNQYFHDAAAANRVVRTAFPSRQVHTFLTRETFIMGADPYAEFNYGMLKPVIRGSFVREHGLAYRENARLSEDFLYLVEFLAAGGTGLLVSRPLYHWTQPFGSISRQWTTTGAGSWRYDFQSALTANGEVRKLLRQGGDTALVRLLDARARAFRHLHHISEISRMQAGSAGGLRTAAAIARHPSIWPRLVQRLLRNAWRRKANLKINNDIVS
jgi:glycosyltransferase involved in cell wall biosynthesis